MSYIGMGITAILPLIGVALGAGLTHYFSRTADRTKQLEALRTQAYVDYLKAVAKFAQAAKTNPEQRLTFLAEAADAKTRICIYGSKKSVEILAEFEKKGASLSSPDALSVFADLCSQMRLESIDISEVVPNTDIRLILFGAEK